jgi:Zn-finger nucleic acid-binding protein
MCNIELKMSERSGIEIDYCSQCRGVWLDRGELDKLIERSLEQMPASGSQPVAPPTVIVEGQPRRDYPRYNNEDYYYKYKKRKSLLGEIFDF